MRNSVEHHVKRRNQDKLCKASLGSSVCSFVAYSILPLSHKTCHFTNVSLYRWVVGPVYAWNQKKTIFFPIRDLTFSLIQLPHPTPRLLRRSPPPTELIPNLHRPHEEVLRKRERDRVRDPVCAAIGVGGGGRLLRRHCRPRVFTHSLRSGPPGRYASPLRMVKGSTRGALLTSGGGGC